MSWVRTARHRVKELVDPSPPPPYPYPQSKWLPPWAQILHRERRTWQKAIRNSEHGPHVLVATSFGGHAPSTIIESMLAVALTLRGARVHLLLCDEVLAGCQQLMIGTFADVHQLLEQGHARVCKACFAPSYQVYKSLGLPVHRYSEFLDPVAQQRAYDLSRQFPLDEISEYALNDIAVGEHALAGALRFFARGELEQTEEASQVLRRYLQAALQTTFAVECLLTTEHFSSACFNHGIYVPQGLIGEVARKHKVRVVNWTAAYRKSRFIFSHRETYHHALMTEPVSNWEKIPWSAELEAQTLDYLKSRWKGTRDWIWFHEKPQEELQAIVDELGIDFSRPSIGLLTNVLWDAQLHYPANAFPNMLDWVVRTIQYFAERPELQLIIRVHPAEIRGTVPSRQLLVEEINKAFPQLPHNIFVIPPESNISTYAAMLQCNAVLIYGTKTGVELTSFGIPVIVAGEAWIRNKGITIDAKTADDYFRLLEQLPLENRLDRATQERALKYAYHFFFRRMIPLERVKPETGWPPYRLQIESLKDLAPGQSPGLDVICEGIMKGTEFVYPAEILGDGIE